MKIIYGNSICKLHNPLENVISIEIKYRGNIIIKHKHREVVEKLSNNLIRVKNKNKTSTLKRMNNKIRIEYQNKVDIELFKWIGEFRIISAKVNNKNVPIEVFGVDYWNMINSDWDSAGKPENYKGNYKFGCVPQKKTSKRRKNKTLRQPSSTSTQSSGRSY